MQNAFGQELLKFAEAEAMQEILCADPQTSEAIFDNTSDTFG
jgi:hypothetical protein